MAFLKSEDHTIELFTLERNVTSWVPQIDRPGFRCMELSRPGQAGTGDPQTASVEIDSNCVPMIAAGQ